MPIKDPGGSSLASTAVCHRRHRGPDGDESESATKLTSNDLDVTWKIGMPGAADGLISNGFCVNVVVTAAAARGLIVE